MGMPGRSWLKSGLLAMCGHGLESLPSQLPQDGWRNQDPVIKCRKDGGFVNQHQVTQRRRIRYNDHRFRESRPAARPASRFCQSRSPNARSRSKSAIE